MREMILPMKILVFLKRVVDYSVRIHVALDGSGVATDGLKMSINPFDEIALEEALCIRERGDAAEVVVVSLGPALAEQQLRTGLAMGADRAILIETDSTLEPIDLARAFLEIVRREEPGLVLMGKQSIDGDNNQTGQMLAALWDRPQACFASRLELANGTARVTREIDDGLETIEVDLPAVVTADLRLNEPRYIRLPEILKAKKKPLVRLEPGELLPAVAAGSVSQYSIVSMAAPPARTAGKRIDSVAELVAALEQRGLLPA
jgi:electron transfer flavoprotein beta subunit